MAEGTAWALADVLHDRYRLERELGRGGMATVYLASDLKHHRSVAIKVLRPELTPYVGPERFMREIQVTAQLDHPHILSLLDSGEAAGLLYYVMPYVDGGSLRERMKRERQLPLDDALQIAGEVADALSYAHGRGIVHRDIKPENILLAAGHARVADFGIARALSAAGGDKLTETGLAVGTPSYMSPEQGAGEHQLDGRSDIYSLGCVLYEMLGGDPPFTGSSAQAILARKFMDPVPRLQVVRQTIPQTVERAIEKALARVPADRFATATQFAEALKQADDTGARPAGIAPRLPRRLRRGLVMGTPFVAAALAGWWLMAGSRADAMELKAIAVLPCENLTRDTAQKYVGDRWTEELIDKLSQVAELRPKSWLSMQRYKATRKGAREIADEVGGAGTLVRCRVTETEDSLRLTVQAIGATSDQVLWSRQYARPLSAMNINAVQTEVATEIAGVLGVAPSPSERARLERPPTQDTEALKAFRLGRHFLGLLDMEKSVAYFQQAIARDSLFAPAYVGLADATLMEGTRPSREFVPDAVRLVLKALAIDPALAEAHTLLASYLFWYNHDWPAAEQEYRRALELNPNSLIAHLWYGLDLTIVGHHDRAIRELEKAVELDPAFPLARIQLISGLRVARERRMPRQHLVQHTPERVDVAAPVQRLRAATLLRAHVRRRPHRDPSLGEPLPTRGRDRPCDPEVRHARMPRREQNVLRLDVAVHNVAAVRVAQGVGHFPRDLEGILERQLPLAVEPLAQRLALDVGHDVVEKLGGRAVGRSGGQSRPPVHRSA